MNAKSYLLISGLIFDLVFLAHLVRIWQGWSLQVGTWSVPMSASWIALVLTGFLAVSAYLLYRKQ